MQSIYHSDAGNPMREIIVITPTSRWRKRNSESKSFAVGKEVRSLE